VAATGAIALVAWAAVAPELAGADSGPRWRARTGLAAGMSAGVFAVLVLLSVYLRRGLPGAWLFPAAVFVLAIGGVLGLASDAWRRVNRALLSELDRSEKERKMFELLLDQLPDPTFAIDTRHRVILWNKAAEKLSGVSKADMLGRGDYEHALPFYGVRRPLLVDLVLGDRLESPDIYEKTQWVGDHLVGEGYAPLGGEGITFWSVAAPLYGPDGRITGAVQTVRDIGERKKTEERLLHLGTHDHLTGLYNRAYFEQKMLEISGSGPVSVIVCDVDGLKLVNDTFGHLIGDELLRRTAALIAGELRASDCVARVGGDEFAILLPDTDEETACTVCRRLVERMVRENRERPGLPFGISAGSATTRYPGEPLEQVFHRADEAMYRHKGQRGLRKSGAFGSRTGQTRPWL